MQSDVGSIEAPLLLLFRVFSLSCSFFLSHVHSHCSVAPLPSRDLGCLAWLQEDLFLKKKSFFFFFALLSHVSCKKNLTLLCCELFFLLFSFVSPYLAFPLRFFFSVLFHSNYPLSSVRFKSSAVGLDWGNCRKYALRLKEGV